MGKKNKRYVRRMFDNSIVNETSPEANWNRQTGQTGAQDYVLSQADALTKKQSITQTPFYIKL